MALRLYINNVEEVPEDESGLVLGAIGSIATFELRCDAGEVTAEQVVVNAPPECEVSKDGSSYASTATFTAGEISYLGSMVYVKRTEMVVEENTWSGGILTPRLALVEVEAAPDLEPPVLSGTLVATPGAGQATLSGTSATDDSGIAKWQYKVDDGEWTDIADSANETMPETAVTGLSNDVEYDFVVRAVDTSDNPSESSNVASATPVAPENLAPVFDSGPSVGTITRDGCIISATFSDPEEDEVTATYRVVASGGTPNWSGAPAFTSPHPVSGLSFDTAYDAYVRLDDGNGNVVTSEAVPFETLANSAPESFTPTVGNVTSEGCRVTFSTTDDEDDTITYKVAVTESGTPPVDWSAYSDVTSPHDVSGLTPETTYYAHVRAYDGYDATVGTSSSFETQAEAPPEPVEWPLWIGNSAVVPPGSGGTLVTSEPTGTSFGQYSTYYVEKDPSYILNLAADLQIVRSGSVHATLGSASFSEPGYAESMQNGSLNIGVTGGTFLGTDTLRLRLRGRDNGGATSYTNFDILLGENNVIDDCTAAFTFAWAKLNDSMSGGYGDFGWVWSGTHEAELGTKRAKLAGLMVVK